MPVSAAARALALRCERRADKLARRMAHEYFEVLPGYAELPGDVKDVEIAATARHGVRLFLRHVAEPRSGHDGYRVFRERAAQRAEEGMPLQLLLRTHALGMYVLWQALREAAGPGEETALVELVDLLLQHHHGLVGAVAETYLDERSALEAEHQAQRRAVVRGLLDGMLQPGHVLLDQLRLEGAMLVLALGIGRPRAPEGAVVLRRRLRRIQTVLDRTFRTEVLALLDAGPDGTADTGRAVVPAECEPPEDLARRLTKACGLEVRVAAVPAGCLAAVPEAARTAAEILRIARACGLAAGVHRLDDVLLEFHLSRPGPSGDRIAQLLDPVGDRPELVETLRTHLQHRQDRRATAAALGLHPNTVDNRLARIAERTGLDLSSPRGTALALAALMLR